MRSIMKDNRAVAGFFEEIPVLIIVLIGLFLFIASFVHAYGAYIENHDVIKSRDQARQFTENIRSWQGLCDSPENNGGVFSYTKLKSLDLVESMKNEFNTSNLGFQYQVSIYDVSNYNDKVMTTVRTQDLPVELISMVTITSSVVVVVSPEERHAARLVVTVWGW